MRFVRAFLMMSAMAAPALANLPAFDNTGNSMLNGTYYFREVIYVVADGAGDLSGLYATYGTISFNGAGGYTIGNATENACSSSGCGQQAITSGTAGTYTFSASGYGYFTNPLSTSIVDYGLISNGILIASATEAGYNTLFIAVPVSSPVATNSSFQGNYQMAGFLPPSNGSTSSAIDVAFPMNPDGNGNLGTVSLSGYSSGTGAQVYSQSSSVKYSFSNGAGVITFPTSTTANFYSGQEYMYISPDHNFVFGGSPSGFDMFVGVKTSPGNVIFNGIYYEAGLDWDATQLAASGFSSMDTYYGAFNAGSGNVIGHERLFTGIEDLSDGLTYAATYPSSVSSGSYTVTSGAYSTQYTFGNGGAIRISFGVGPALGIGVALQAPTLTGTGVYLNPQGVVNAASYSPFTAGVSPGEIVVLYGTGMAPSFQAASSLPLPTKLNGVTVTVNGVSAPIYYVSPTQLSVVIPYSAYYTTTTGLPVARIVVNNGTNASNAVTEFFNLTTPGIFSQNASGIGLGSIYHVTSAGFSAVTENNPAQPGETVVAYVSGMGSTLPSVVEGNPGPTSPLANTVNDFDIFIGGTEACGAETNATPCPFVGLAPYLANVYQFNIPIPSTATSGDNSVEILGPDSDAVQVVMPVGNGAGATSARPGPTPQEIRAGSHRRARPSAARVMPCFVTDPSCVSLVGVVPAQKTLKQ